MTDVVTLLYSTAYSIIFPLDYLAQTIPSLELHQNHTIYAGKQLRAQTFVHFSSFFFFEEEKELILNL